MAVKVGNVAWSALDAILASVQALVAAFIVARLIGPSEVGIGASVIATQLIAAQILSSLSDVLVQRQAIDERIASSFACYLVLFALALGVVLMALAIPMAGLLEDDRVIPMSSMMAASLAPHAYAAALSQWLVRQRDFRKLFWRSVACATPATLAGIWLAYAGWGAWAMTVPSAIIPMMSAVATAWVCPWRPSWRWHWSEVRPMLPFAVPQMLAGLAWGARYRVFFTLLAGTATPHAMGHVHMAFRAVDSIGVLLFATVQRLMLPQMARVQHDIPTLRDMHDRFVRLVCLVGLPAFAVVGLCVGPLFAIGLGPGWEPAVEGAVLLAVLGGYQTWRLSTGSAITARGLSKPSMWLGFFVLALTAVAQFIWRPVTPVDAAVIWVVPMIIAIWPQQLIARRALEGSFFALLRPGTRAVLVTLLAIAITLAVDALFPPQGAFATLVLRGGVFAIAYVASVFMVLRQDLRDALEAVGVRRGSVVGA